MEYFAGSGFEQDVLWLHEPIRRSEFLDPRKLEGKRSL